MAEPIVLNDCLTVEDFVKVVETQGGSVEYFDWGIRVFAADKSQFLDLTYEETDDGAQEA